MRKSLVVLVLLAACGDDGVHHLPDAPAAPDAAVDGATTGPVSLTITLDGQPVAAHDVYFQTASGALVAKVPTNAQGIATAMMDVGGYVTTVDPFAGKLSAEDIRTFAGVKPGDQLKLRGSTGTGFITITFTAPTDANAIEYQVFSSCGAMQNLSGGGGSGGIPTGPIGLSGCGGTADFLILTMNGSGPANFLYKAGVAVADQGVVDLSTETYTSPVPSVALDWKNVPAAFSSVSFRNVLASARGPIFDQLLSTNLTGGVGAMTIQRGTITNGISITSTEPTPTNGIAQQFVVNWAPAAPTITVDLAGALLAPYTTAPTISTTTRAATWVAGAGVTPDLVVATVSGSRTGATGSTFWDWQIAMPYAATTFTLPVLPAGIDQFNFVAGDTGTVSELRTAKVPGGYDAVRAEVLSASQFERFAVGPTGTLAYEQLEQVLPARRVPREKPLHRESSAR